MPDGGLPGRGGPVELTANERPDVIVRDGGDRRSPTAEPAGEKLRLPHVRLDRKPGVGTVVEMTEERFEPLGIGAGTKPGDDPRTEVLVEHDTLSETRIRIGERSRLCGVGRGVSRGRTSGRMVVGRKTETELRIARNWA
ncbi:hypothetical protein FTUN_8796 [Frigoriglobus tundricola]|uniref:Uncharacterized protein n=1 Tax=Frigoriglobus tundricola TaxID=2774151 RepID=A0A6M5Z5Q6_9BACT|nr:hypothetical protein FTUN_8796 [Frigoriglobus tundricola]